MRVVIYGFGQIGRLIAKSAIKKGFEVVGAVDVNPELVGKKIHQLDGFDELGISSEAAIKDSLDFEDVDVVFLTTGSFVPDILPELKECIESGFDVVSSCETLSYPEFRYPELAREINQLAIENNVSVLGAGINPGFLLDLLPAVLSATSVEVKKIRAVRSADALKRRSSFQKKIGLGMEVNEVQKKLGKELTGHVGYGESVCLIADALNFTLEDVEEGQEIVVAKDDCIVEAGKVLGLIGFGSGIKNGEEVIRVEFHAYAGAEEYEEVVIEGDNPVVWRSSGTKGDIGTANVLVNLAKSVVNSEPGLIKISDIIPFR
jgi:4-hydroxy-tetrahydrodipicolinate reductase